MTALFGFVVLSLFGAAGVDQFAQVTGADPSLIQLLNTAMNMFTVLAIIYHSRHVRRDLGPKVDQIGSAVHHVEQELAPWDGTTERRDDYTDPRGGQ